jgi:hypothetical protein
VQRAALQLGLRFLAYGVAGWVLENVVSGPRYSAVFGGAKVPLLPVYGIGGLVIGAARPALSDMTPAARAISYGGVLSAVEVATCKLDRAMGWQSWSYDGDACVDLPHALAWGALGLAAETVEARLR